MKSVSISISNTVFITLSNLSSIKRGQTGETGVKQDNVKSNWENIRWVGKREAVEKVDKSEIDLFMLMITDEVIK